MRLNARAPIIIRGDEIAHLDADGYKHLPRAASLPDGKILASSGGAWRPSDLSGVSVSSVFGRTGAVAAQTGDYTAAQVGAEPYAGVPAQTSFWRSTAAGVRAWVQLVAADITDLATTLAAYLPKSNPSFTGHLYQDGNQRITADGLGRFDQLLVDTLASSNLPLVTDIAGVLRNKYPADFRAIIEAAKAPSKQDISASANLGSIDASAIKVTATDVTLTCSGGFDGQGWDIIGPYAIGIGVPSGVTLYRFAGVTVGPATYAPGGGRALRVVRVDASTWIMPNLS